MKKKYEKIISWVLLIAAIGTLAAVGVVNIWHKFEKDQITLKEYAFGLPQGTLIYAGRSFSLKADEQKLKPHAQRLFEKAEDYHNQGRYSQALTHYEEILRTNKNAHIACYKISELLLNYSDSAFTDTARVLDLYNSVLEKDPGHPLFRYKLGELLWAGGQYEEAFAQYQLAADISPMFPQPYLGLGRYYLRREQFAQAKMAFKTAISLLDGGSEAPYGLLALTYYRMGQDDSSALVVEYAKSIGLTNGRIRLVEGLLWEEAGNLDAARLLFDALIGEDSTNADAKWGLETLGNKPPRVRLVDAFPPKARGYDQATAAIELLEPLVYRFQREAPLWYALGQAYLRRQLYAHAIECFDSALIYDSTLMEASRLKEKAFSALLIRDSLEIYNGLSFLEHYDSLNQTISVSAALSAPLPKRAILGHFDMAWGSFQEDVISNAGYGRLTPMKNGNLRQMYYDGSIRYEYILGFKEGKLWGIYGAVTDTAQGPGDLFGRLIADNSKISGNGTGTGSVECEGYKEFQGAIWENDDTFEFMVQFANKSWQVRLALIAKANLPEDQKLCNLIKIINTDTWTK